MPLRLIMPIFVAKLSAEELSPLSQMVPFLYGVTSCMIGLLETTALIMRLLRLTKSMVVMKLPSLHVLADSMLLLEPHSLTVVILVMKSPAV
jgi:hypothetical protein